MSIANNHQDLQPRLPVDFSPGPHDVVIGKGKKFYFHNGNAWLRQVVRESWLGAYKQANTKPAKSQIITQVVEFVRLSGKFVKKSASGEWLYAEELLCREKCSQAFRDALHNTYRSSNVAKKNKRRREQQEKVVAEKKEQEAKRQRSAQFSPMSIGVKSDLFDWNEMPSQEVHSVPPMNVLVPENKACPCGQDIITVLAEAISLSNLDDEDESHWFEPTPLPPSMAQFPAVTETTGSPFESMPLLSMPEVPPAMLSMKPNGFLKDDSFYMEPRSVPLRGFESLSFSFKGDDSFDELSTISDMEALKAFNEESFGFDLGPNIQAAFAA